MKQQNYKWLIPLIASILLGLSTWVLVSVNQIQTDISSIQNELQNVDKQFGRIFYWFDKFTSK
tara:strand:+ start:286 stop:474 length:189 start_codon:yes stop_codon:yes gene_type:complete